MWAVLTLLVAVDMYILAREDIVRHRADRVANAQQVERVCCADGSGPDEATVTWAELREGDVVRVRDKQFIPADMLLLRGSDRPAEVYVKTQSLDGETDAKMRLAPKLAASRLAQSKCGAPELRAVLRGHVRCEAPDDKVNDFTGQLVLESVEDGQTERCVLSEENLMLRGSQLVHTKWALGVVVACGMDSKIEFGRAKGSEATKTGHTTALMNRDIYAMVAWLISLDLLASAVNAWMRIELGEGQPWFLPSTETGPPTFWQWFILTLSYFMTTFPLIPVGLYVSANIILVLGKYFMQQDRELYYEETDEPCMVRQMSLLDELGQVTHIFSDKTGTLTANNMEFRRLAAGGRTYGIGATSPLPSAPYPPPPSA